MCQLHWNYHDAQIQSSHHVNPSYTQYDQYRTILRSSPNLLKNTGQQSIFLKKYRTKQSKKDQKIPENQSKKGPKIPDYSKGLVLWPKIPDKYRTKLVQIGQKIPDRTSPNKGSSGKNHTACNSTKNEHFAQSYENSQEILL